MLILKQIYYEMYQTSLHAQWCEWMWQIGEVCFSVLKSCLVHFYKTVLP
jgi:hypothetical protein